MAPTGEPKDSRKPQPMGGNMPMIFLFTTCTLCALFLLWRRADALRSVISHQLKTLTHSNTGAIRLSEDDGPPVIQFLEDDYDDDNEGLRMDDEGDEPLTERLPKWSGGTHVNGTPHSAPSGTS
ncbi:hypothetical protein C8J57DRAFT_297685 [Mycena rebaudengoi]|nr:hypothetical protein C8J57DRAFT_297685 [Mycena rebaudengoi]